ncbi:Cthe_2314 family HEPN domain-containing protein [Paenibacillus sp. FSL R7-0652]|uniref:Cthe_2314 family HEPN domain-containing protein n=1 Tax=Paenibacillus sp. AN1007 TaxID=3151385 RepID=A0AAU8NCZ7_9BACL
MLRTLLGEKPRVNQGLLKEAMDTMAFTLESFERQMHVDHDPNHDYRKLYVWTQGLISSLDELEQSCFAAAHFRQKVVAGSTEDMSAAEKAEYARYVYFYKDAFIRCFAILDKLGTVLNEIFQLNTSKTKVHFSYYTVLRQFDYHREHHALALQLIQIKDKYREPMSRLRKRRNMEIHYMNSEMQDDLWQLHQTMQGKVKLEDLDQHLLEMQQGVDMVCETLHTAYRYINKIWRKQGARR